MLCHYKLEKALEDQHKALEATLEELRQYKKQHEGAYKYLFWKMHPTT